MTMIGLVVCLPAPPLPSTPLSTIRPFSTPPLPSPLHITSVLFSVTAACDGQPGVRARVLHVIMALTSLVV